MIINLIWPAIQITQQAIKTGGPYICSVFEGKEEGWAELTLRNNGEWYYISAGVQVSYPYSLEGR